MINQSLSVVGVAVMTTSIIPILLIISVHLLPHNRQYLGEELKKATLDSNVRRVRELLMKGADVNWRDDYDWTALHWASFGKPHIIKVLLISSPNINQRSILGDTALHHACNGGYLPCVKLLLVTGQCDTG